MSDNPATILQQLIRFDTTNPPGNEAACIAWLQQILSEGGIATQLIAHDPARPNLIARLPGRGAAPPLLLQGHVDVVATAGQKWRYPPFEGRIAEGYVWGRGALDMKGGVAMMVAALLRLRESGALPPGDILLALMADEEAGSGCGARFLVEAHPHLFDGVRYALGEFGGFTFTVGTRRFYPIMVTEKQSCWVRATVRGPAGHGASIMRGGAMARLGRLLTALDRARLPVHITPVARRMIEDMLSAFPSPLRPLAGQVLNPGLAGATLAALGAQGRLLEPLLRNTVNATRVAADGAINVVPAAVALDLDARLLPGLQPADLLAELRPHVGADVELAVHNFEPGPARVDLTHFGALGKILRELDPGATPTPLMVNGVTDARFFARLGIQTYGFLPMRLPPDFNFSATIHAADERIPLDTLEFGATAIGRAIERI
jgi:acetylornithine deacetylase/succinyl-diaminopimelate desuccinylase-like protein